MAALNDALAATFARIEAEADHRRREWIASQPRYIADELPKLPAQREALTGPTMTLERDPGTGERVVAERVDGRLVTVHQVAHEYDQELVDGASVLAAFHPDKAMRFVPDVLQLPPCPDWCTEKHMHPDEEHLGPGVYVDGPGFDWLATISIERQAGGQTQAIFTPSADRPQPIGLDQLRALRDGLADVIAVLEAEMTATEGE